MLNFNPVSKVLEEEVYHYQLQDVAEPVLYRELFSYDSVPKIAFNHRIVPMNPAARFYLSDTTFRDGQQAMQPFSPEQSLRIYDLLHKLGGPNGVIRQTEFFVYSERDRKTVRLCQERGYEFPEVTSWIRASRKDFKLVREMGIKETGILTSASDYHIFLKLKKKRSQAMDEYLTVVKMALEEGIRPRCHLEDITRADFYGFVVPFVRRLMALSRESKVPIKIRACDTLGLGITHPGVALPRSVKGIVHGLRTHAEVPEELLEWHGHNDFYRGVAAASTAWLYGCGTVNCACLGLGERTGNTPLEAMVIEYCALRGGPDGMSLPVITEIAEFFQKEMGYAIPPKQPFVGEDFNVTRAGIHADGLSKDQEIYNIFDTKILLNRPYGVAVTDKSGLAGIAEWINIRFRLEKEKRVSKDHPGISAMKDKIDAQYDGGRITQISERELAEMVKEFLPELAELAAAL